MSKLSLKDLKIEMPLWFKGNPTENDLVEWLEYELGARADIKLSNPLQEIEIKDCKVSIGETKLDGKAF